MNEYRQSLSFKGKTKTWTQIAAVQIVNAVANHAFKPNWMISTTLTLLIVALFIFSYP